MAGESGGTFTMAGMVLKDFGMQVLGKRSEQIGQSIRAKRRSRNDPLSAGLLALKPRKQVGDRSNLPTCQAFAGQIANLFGR